MKIPVILLVDDEDSIIATLKGSLEDEGYIVLISSDGKKALEIIKSQPVDLVFLDIWLPEMDGLTTLRAIKDFNSAIEVVMMTGHGSVNTAVQAIKEGAFDFLEKPFSLDTVIELINQIIKKQQSGNDKADAQSGIEDDELVLIGNDQSIVRIRNMIPRIARSDEDVLLTGRSGSGKEFVSRLIHLNSRRKKSRLVKINCAFYTPQKLEAALFGYRKGKGQTCGKKSVIFNAKDSTIFLGAVDTLPLRVQERLANVISNPQLKGSNARIIAALNHDLEKPVKSRTFHKGLVECFPRVIEMPALKNRREDIPLLLDMFVDYFCKDYGFKKKHIEDDALEILVNYDWPGNVKELKNLVEKMVVSVPTRNITAHDIPPSLRDEMQYGMVRYYERYETMEESEAAWRKNYLLYYLRKYNKDVRKTAAKLQIREETLKKYIEDYGIILKEKKPEKKFQRTLKRSIVLGGTGLHSGDKTGLILTPLPPDSGIVFGNISSGEKIPADIDYVVSTNYATCLQNEKTRAFTVEHLLATLHAYRITNLMIKINNEVPIMDGSALDFCRLIEDAGIEDQDEWLEEFIIEEKHILGKVKKKRKFITVEPADKLIIHYILQYPKPVGLQEYTFTLDGPESFKKEIAPARTFGFVKDIEALEKKGLASGGRLSNFILIDDEKIINTDLRFPDEFVRHKILDMLGDLYLLGHPIIGRITANMTGHTENAELIRMLRNQRKL
ncbi:MAG: UDP-3-O-[3-hydroxymyristoyl] N-acetylglucosamine deacetylase [Deltaproteobacteria bacterium]|nr:MAG: UDP-3-O-[3-hydroxymyristoyl] N-acetylglucosamine deacetylase [Deltaproteobacteria bacterium]